MITQEELKSQVNYDQETGIFTWKVRNSNRIKIGDQAGNYHNGGYIEMYLLGERHLAHRLAWLYVNGYMPKIIDHIDGNKLNNKISNLREVSYAENMYNSKIRSDNKSGVRCVSWNKKHQKWEVRVKIDGKLKNYGYYKELDDAAKVAEKVRKEHHTIFFK
jgi:hypothetical protein